MYQRKSNLLNIVIMILDCVCITVSLILANYFRNGRAFVSDNDRMDFGLMLGGCLVAFLAWNFYKNLYKDMFLRGPFSELIHIVGNNAVIFSGAAILLFFMKRLDAYSRLVFVYFILLFVAEAGRLVYCLIQKSLGRKLSNIFRENANKKIRGGTFMFWQFGRCCC